MIKGILLSIVLLASTGIGRTLACERRRRCEKLAELTAAMRVLRLRMLNSLEPIGILLRKSEAELFRMMGNGLSEGVGLEECWHEKRTYARKSAMLADLQDDDLKILDGFFEGLGKTGRDEQNELFSKVLAEMEEVYSVAKKRYEEASKLFTALGTVTGLGICILIV